MLVPILPSSDLDRSLAYYRYLGFDLLERADDYARLSWRDAELHLYPNPAVDPLANSAGCYLKVADPDALRAAWSGDGVDCVEVVGAAETNAPDSYGPTAFAVVDPDGNTLRIGPTTSGANNPTNTSIATGTGTGTGTATPDPPSTTTSPADHA
jgi:catechol 2,3-dioxygenase-like lactoylglutathione lyase family enzyme